MIFSPTDHRPGEHLTADLLAQLGDDVRQLTEPWSRVVWQEQRSRWWDINRNLKIRTRRWSTTITHPSLLDQLRAAVHPHQAPSRTARPSRVPGPRQPAAIDAASAFAVIHRELAIWVSRAGASVPIRISGVPRWQEAALRALVGRAPELSRHEGELLVAAVRRWWTLAGKQSGWSTRELLMLLAERESG